MLPNCAECGSERVNRAGWRHDDEKSVQRFLCKDCGYRFSFGNNANKKCLTNRGHQLSVILKEAKKLDSATETKTVVGEEKQTTRGKLLQFAFYLKKEGKTKGTISTYGSLLRRLAQKANLEDPDTVKAYLAETNIAVNTKACYRVAYTAFLSWQGKTWKPPKYTAHSPIPEFLPTEQEIDQLISGCGRKTATILQTIKETGMRIGECLSLTWIALNDKANTLTLNTPEKHGLPRIFSISPKLVMMLQALPKKRDKIFGVTKPKTAQINFASARQSIARKVKNPRLAKIHFHLIRHWKGTMEYHKTHDVDYVRRLLGHRSVLPTQIYINMEQAIFAGNADEYIVKRARNSKEEDSLISVGFEYVRYDEADKSVVYRKRK